jgi:hypothetical protein
MATIHSLAAAGGPLTLIAVPLGRAQPLRSIYGLSRFTNWMTNTLPNLQAGRLKGKETPQQQLDFRLFQWIAGKPIVYSRMFNDLMPHTDEVWEMKTLDVRVFGWMYRPLTFVAVFGDYADLYKGKTATRSYETAKADVIAARARLDLDLPKFTGGTFDELVSI